MEIILELFLTAFMALLFSFLIAKIVSLAMGGDSVSVSGSGVGEKSLVDVTDEVIMEELEFAEKLKVQGFESEKKVEFAKGSNDKVDVYGTEQAGVDDQGFKSEKKVECVQETADINLVDDESEAAAEDEVAETLKVQGFESEKEVESLQETAKKADDLEAEEQIEVGEAEGEVKLDDIVAHNRTKKQEVGEIGEQLEAEVENETKVQSEEIRVEERQMKGLGEEEKEVKLDSDDDDDWEGIEKSELHKVFADAAKFVEHKGDLEGLGNDVQMELYGLHKIATEGPCREPQPLAFMVSSRSKCDGQHCLHCARNAWQRLGNMNPEAAMEQYVALLSDRVPEWREENLDGTHTFESADRGVPSAMAPDINSLPDQQSSFIQERNEDLKSATGGGITESTSFEKQAKD